VKVCVELPSNNSGKAFARLSSRACNLVEIGSAPIYFVDPKIDLRSIECSLSIIVPKTGNDFGPWRAFTGEEFDHIALFEFHILDTLSPRERRFPAYISRL
jgi:hypothetical protein